MAYCHRAKWFPRVPSATQAIFRGRWNCETLPQSKPSVAGLLAVFSQPSLLKQGIPAGYVDAKVPANVWPATEYLPPFLLLQSFYASLSILQRKFLLVGSLRMLAVLSFPSFFL